ncbi:MAG: STAS domain-containing protein [Eubacteriales bacterium]|jgi:anti-sigma B factor antagonist|uniref:STAS domain-containing protein n=1 Tax=Fenollaria sp. TaxID=1965292 RepID=UPI002A750535|nr:STAS domain-containing protein [Fenollaria sp.]MDD7340357.1 STAS domain-containing protein [Eubacteriales bacterium]MDY3105251.1 STAS domain-containing protein [Fenollaria sp.]
MFDLNLIDQGDHYLIELIGDLDIYNNKKFKEKLADIYEDLDKDLVVDCSRLEYIDSTGLGSFISLLKLTRDEEKEITVKNLKKNIKKVFKITDLDKLFNLGDDE